MIIFSVCFHSKSPSDGVESQVYSLKHRNFIPVPCNSDASNNSNSAMYAGRASGAQRSGEYKQNKIKFKIILHIYYCGF